MPNKLNSMMQKLVEIFSHLFFKLISNYKYLYLTNLIHHRLFLLKFKIASDTKTLYALHLAEFYVYIFLSLSWILP